MLFTLGKRFLKVPPRTTSEHHPKPPRPYVYTFFPHFQKAHIFKMGSPEALGTRHAFMYLAYIHETQSWVTEIMQARTECQKVWILPVNMFPACARLRSWDFICTLALLLTRCVALSNSLNFSGFLFLHLENRVWIRDPPISFQDKI